VDPLPKFSLGKKNRNNKIDPIITKKNRNLRVEHIFENLSSGGTVYWELKAG
jgi:hypothetical protein